MFGRQLVLLTDFHPNTGASRLAPTQWWVKALRRNIAYQFTYKPLNLIGVCFCA
ncbi:MAG: hypothetical protein LBC02_12685 [Planctomycetaceae bacterium]|nr:hypothetical protein [Planctomycetaceae bacterium]